jgi:hypothetical protein
MNINSFIDGGRVIKVLVHLETYTVEVRHGTYTVLLSVLK